ncbi:MAG: hypothetical protein HRU20_25385 [Pseudomonadales bacterium]|nr:hypothetical protein [Pseudomonadales bacterium]
MPYKGTFLSTALGLAYEQPHEERYCHCCSRIKPGGSERAGGNLANKLSRFYDVAIIPTNDTDIAYTIFDGVELAAAVSSPEKSFIARNIHLLSTLLKTLRQYQADIVITFTGRSSVYSFITAKLLNTNCIISSERCNPTLEEESRLWLRIINLAYKHSTHLVLQTNEIKALYPDFNNLTVVPNTSAVELAALIPPPKLNLTRFHGVFAPNHKLRKAIIREKNTPKENKKSAEVKSPAYRLTWAQRLKRVFNIDIETCSQCGGRVKIISTIKDPIVIKKILDHISKTQELIPPAFQLPETHAPPTRLNT